MFRDHDHEGERRSNRRIGDGARASSPHRSRIAINAAAAGRRCVVAIALTLVSTIASADATDAPFEATITTKEVLRPNPIACRSFPFLAGTTTGTGTASHLGAVTGKGTDCIHPGRKGLYSFTNGKLTLIAASGETLRAEYSGKLTPTATAKVYTIAGTFRITGGTGRFAAATGNGLLSGVENISTLVGQFEFTGTISY